MRLIDFQYFLQEKFTKFKWKVKQFFCAHMHGDYLISPMTKNLHEYEKENGLPLTKYLACGCSRCNKFVWVKLEEDKCS